MSKYQEAAESPAEEAGESKAKEASEQKGPMKPPKRHQVRMKKARKKAGLETVKD